MISLSQFYSLNLTHRIRLGPTNVFYGVLNLNMITRLSELQFEGIAILTLNGDSVMPPSDWIKSGFLTQRRFALVALK